LRHTITTKIRILSTFVITIMVALAATPNRAASSSQRQTRTRRAVSNAYLPDKRVNAPLAACIWQGGTSSAWTNAANWSGCSGGGGLPGTGDTVLIDPKPFDPTLSAHTTPTLSTVTVNSGATLLIDTGGVLTTNADFALNGGTLRFSSDGTANIGTGGEDSLIYTNGSALTFLAGATGSLNVGGRLSPTLTSDSIAYNQAGGTVTVAIVNSSDATFGAFYITSSSTFTMSGGTIILDQPSTGARDCEIFAPDGGVTGGTLQFGDATGANTGFGSHFGIDSTPELWNLTVAHPNADTLNIGSDVTVNNTLTLSGGNIISLQSATLIIDSSASINRTNGSFVICALQKNGLTSPFIFHVGSTSDNGVTPIGYTPVSLTNVTGTAGTSLRVLTTASVHPAVNASTSLQEYWTLTQVGSLTADLTFTYLQGDVQGNEANYRVIRISGGTPVSFPTTVLNTVNNTATIAGVSTFSDWTVGENVTPTAAPARVSGQIVDSNGQPVGGATVTVNGGSVLIRAITDSNGFYRVEHLETGEFYSVTPSRANYVFAPANRSFSLVADRADAMFSAASIEPNASPLESPEFFVRQQYLDFLGREPEQSGLDYWSGQLRACGNDGDCINERRTTIAGEFYITQEFQESGLYLYDIYEGALGRRPDHAEYAVDRRSVVGGPHLETDKAAFATSFVARAEFSARYPLTMSNEVFVDALLQTAEQSSGVDLSSSRGALIALYNSGASTTDSRSLVLRSVAEDSRFKQTQYNPAFVLMEYYGYLGRNPDRAGYAFWLNVLNDGGRNNYRGMVCSFITSAEYQQRFSPVVTRSNAQCGGQ
jgi:hypothetical protein